MMRQTRAVSLTSEAVGGAAVTVDHAARIPGPAPGHRPAVVEGLPRPAERRTLLLGLRGDGLVTPAGRNGLVLGVKGTNNWGKGGAALKS